MTDRIHWGRIAGLAFALEAALFATLLPLQPLISPKQWLWAVAAGCALFSYIAGWLAGRRLPSRRLLHGFLVGVLATAIYVAINQFQPGGVLAAVAFYGAPLFLLLNLLRIAGCTIGAAGARGGAIRPATVVPR